MAGQCRLHKSMHRCLYCVGRFCGLILILWFRPLFVFFVLSFVLSLVAMVGSCLRGGWPPVHFRAVCLVRAMVNEGPAGLLLWKNDAGGGRPPR